MRDCTAVVSSGDKYDEYWVDDRAAAPVLLVDQAADAISEALYRVRAGSELDPRDLAAAGVALRDLLGGVGQLAGLLSMSAGRYAQIAPAQAGQLENRLETLRANTLHAQRAAEGVERSSAAISPEQP